MIVTKENKYVYYDAIRKWIESCETEKQLDVVYSFLKKLDFSVDFLIKEMLFDLFIDKYLLFNPSKSENILRIKRLVYYI